MRTDIERRTTQKEVVSVKRFDFKQKSYSFNHYLTNTI